MKTIHLHVRRMISRNNSAFDAFLAGSVTFWTQTKAFNSTGFLKTFAKLASPFSDAAGGKPR